MATGSAGRHRSGRFFVGTDKDRQSGRVVTSDSSYREALGRAAWDRLPAEVKARFSVKPGAGQTIRYRGDMRRVELSFMGWLFAQVCRLIGTPLAPYRGRDAPMSIALTPDDGLGGVAWLRTYEFPGNRHFTVRSTKCKATNNEFIEHIGCGFSMRLKLTEENGSLVFTSAAYTVRLFGRDRQIPSLLTPGATTVRHEQLTGDQFRFSLAVDHPFLGRTIFQEGEFYSDVSDV